ncbi:MAG: hypothetical protein U0359_38875 [Byssovorax sp.]
MKTTWMTPVLCGLAALLSVSSAGADKGGAQPFGATIDVSEQFIPTDVPGVNNVVLDGAGLGAHLGQLTFAATELIDFRQFFRPDLFPSPQAVVTDGEMTITAANGDQLTATYDGYGVPDPSRPGFFNGFATATLTGGTGRFRCASGTVPFTLDINAAALTEVITFDGSANLWCNGDH